MNLLIIGFVLNEVAISFSSSVISNTWRRNAALDNYISVSGYRSRIDDSSLFKCGQSCTGDSHCYSFFYDGGSNLCHLEGTIKSTTAGLSSRPGTRYYASTDEQLGEQVCGVDDSDFNLVKMSDNTYIRIRVFNNHHTFDSARLACESLQATLFKPITAARNTLLQDLLQCPGYTSFYYVDGKKDSQHSPWTTWDNQHTYTTTYWKSPNPDKPEAEFCLQIVQNGGWNDVGCTWPSGVICEKSI